MKHFLGISAGFHDAAAAVVDSNGEIVFAAHSERYSKKKNDADIDPLLRIELSRFEYQEIAFYERPWMHNLQQMISGQKHWGPWTVHRAIDRHLGRTMPGRLRSWPHHLSHAAAGFQTSNFDQAAVVVIDAIGELDTISIYKAWYDTNGRAQYQRVWRQSYPHSIGLFYSAVTDAVGLRPMEEEYITMGMAAYGSRLGTAHLLDQVVDDVHQIKFSRNLHIGFDDVDHGMDAENLAAAAQGVTELLVGSIMKRAQQLTGCTNLVYMGGVALNCVVNSNLGRWFDQIWIMPNPGDAGSSLGAAALSYGRRLVWRDAFLGHKIGDEYPVHDLVDHLIKHKIAGVASGRAEFGPRALGNRSLLADPRGADIKDRVNDIKRRQRFRPFAPVILEEHVDRYFRLPNKITSSPYMQYVMTCLQPDKFPAICHVDGTSRVQTVPPGKTGIRRLLEAWYKRTGCPMLLNTSLNVRGEPMVNDRADADRFEQLYQVKVFS